MRLGQLLVTFPFTRGVMSLTVGLAKSRDGWEITVEREGTSHHMVIA